MIEKEDLEKMEKNIKEHIDLKTQPIKENLESMNSKNETEHTALFSMANASRERITRVETKQKTVFGFLGAMGIFLLGILGKLLFWRQP